MLEVKKLSSGTLLDIEYLQNIDGLETAEPHRHEYFEIFWVLNGEGSHSIDADGQKMMFSGSIVISQIECGTVISRKDKNINKNSSLE